MTALHDAAVKQGAMQQLLVWIGFFELFGFVAIVQMLQGGDRQPGDFGFDPLNLAKDESVRSSLIAIDILLLVSSSQICVTMAMFRISFFCTQGFLCDTYYIISYMSGKTNMI